MLDKLLPKQNAIIRNGLVETMKHRPRCFPTTLTATQNDDENERAQKI